MLPLGRTHLSPGQILEDDGAEGSTGFPVSPSALEEEPDTEPGEYGFDETGVDNSKERPIVLIVEDHPDVRRYLRDRLARRYRPLEAQNAEKGFALATRKVPDLVITDVMMPGLDGFELCRTLKEDMRTSHIPVILLTARGSEESRLEGLGTGADDYLIKPFNTRELLARVENLIQTRRKLRERFSREILVKPGSIAVGSADEAFLRKAMAVLERFLADSDFGVTRLAEELGFSRRQLHRKITALTGEPPADLVRNFRLERAADLLLQKAGTVSEIAYATGFKSPSHFSNLFHEHYGVPPSEYVLTPQKS